MFIGQLHLNRQVILLMSALGVPDGAFFDLQEAMLQHIGEILICEKKAARCISKVGITMYLFSFNTSISRRPKHIATYSSNWQFINSENNKFRES